MSSPEAHTLTGAYALHSLTELESARFERHLVECPDCAREVSELSATAARLGSVVAMQPPERLRGRVLRDITNTRQEAPGARGRAPAGRAPRRRSLRLTAAAAAIALLAAGGFAGMAVHTRNQLDATRAQLAQARAQFSPLAAVIAAPDARAISTKDGDCTVMISRGMNEGVLMVAGMDPPPGDHIYQAWVIGVGKPRSVGVFDPGPDAAVPPLAFGDLGGAAKIGITVEPAGGSVQPSGNPLLTLELPH
jgi:anti-sigma-K factor RskA